MIALFILCLILAMFGLIASKNNILSPSVITPTVWMVVLSLFMILNHNLPPLSGQFLGALALWVTMLCLGSLFTQSLRVRAYPEHKPSRLVLDIFFLDFAGYLSVVFTLRKRGVGNGHFGQLGNGFAFGCSG